MRIKWVNIKSRSWVLGTKKVLSKWWQQLLVSSSSSSSKGNEWVCPVLPSLLEHWRLCGWLGVSSEGGTHVGSREGLAALDSFNLGWPGSPCGGQIPKAQMASLFGIYCRVCSCIYRSYNDLCFHWHFIYIVRMADVWGRLGFPSLLLWYIRTFLHWTNTQAFSWLNWMLRHHHHHHHRRGNWTTLAVWTTEQKNGWLQRPTGGILRPI